MSELFTLWIGKLNPISRICIKSWIKLGYSPMIYVNLDDYDQELNNPAIILKDYKDIMEGDPADILPFSDLWRYKRLYFHGGTWIDADMYLLKRLPEDDIIISSERCCLSGAYKRDIEYIPNIGVLRFPKYNPLLKECILKIQNRRTKNIKCNSNMFVFQKLLLNKYTHYNISKPIDYCPVNWSNIKDLYYSSQFTSKYKKRCDQIDEILTNSTAVHCWENLSINKYKVDFEKVNKNSLFFYLNNNVEYN